MATHTLTLRSRPFVRSTNPEATLMSDSCQMAWSRLQAISCCHANQIGPRYNFGRKSISVPDVIKENCEILGRGDESEIKARVLWYVQFYPAVFTDAIAA